ncbi:hypothetical protein VNO77_25772 [Canavalia gladiata]|uniref:Uncharacterized protein n=1 Tax=Canavalia gladiata TaxID=3824 RepID=A0AAN9KU41_CANGL
MRLFSDLLNHLPFYDRLPILTQNQKQQNSLVEGLLGDLCMSKLRIKGNVLNLAQFSSVYCSLIINCNKMQSFRGDEFEFNLRINRISFSFVSMLSYLQQARRKLKPTFTPKTFLKVTKNSEKTKKNREHGEPFQRVFSCYRSNRSPQKRSPRPRVYFYLYCSPSD